MLLVSCFFLLPMPELSVAGKGKQVKKWSSTDAIQKRLVMRNPVEREVEKEKKKQASQFVKTSDNQPVADNPIKSSYIGSRLTKSEGGTKAPDDMKEMPAQEGVERKDGDDVVLFDQSRQEGALDRDGKEGRVVSRPVVRKVRRQPGVPSPLYERSPKMLDSGDDNTDEVALDSHLKEENAEKKKADENSVERAIASINSSKDLANDSPREAEGVEEEGEGNQDELVDVDSSLDPKDEASKGKEGTRNEFAKNVMANERVKQIPFHGKQAAQLTPTGQGASPSTSANRGDGSRLPPPLVRKNRQPVYDPVFSEMAQPGFRTEERRTRTSGKFSFGVHPSLDVEATPIGRYQAIVYRAIALAWYDQCDRNRDLIITGTLRIRILLEPRGNVVSMKLLSRSGASVAQNSFTFVAIKQAPIPPMPPEVRKELIGNRMELFFDFHF